MENKAVRIHGKEDLRLDTFDVPEPGTDEILLKVMSDSVCMSTYKYAEQGEAHKRAPKDLANNPAIVGHETCGIVWKVGPGAGEKYQPGEVVTLLPVAEVDGEVRTSGYYYGTCGGDSQYALVPAEFVATGKVIPFKGDCYYQASLAEPVSCIIAGYKRMYHTNEDNHEHVMGPKAGGSLVIFGACGPMGLEAIEYALQLDDGPQLVVATDVNPERIARADALMQPYVREGRKLVIFNSAEHEDVEGDLLALTDGKGYDDAMVFAPVPALCEQADHVLGYDGCFEFFSGPIDKTLSATINMYDIHYKLTHFMGYSGSLTEDMLDALALSAAGRLHPDVMVTHVGGLESAIDTTLNLPKIPGGKKMVYPQIEMPMTAIDDFAKLGEEDPLFAKLDEACRAHGGIWCPEAEHILLEHFGVETDVNASR